MFNRLGLRDWGSVPRPAAPPRALLICCTEDCLPVPRLAAHLRAEAVEWWHAPANVVSPYGAASPEVAAAIEEAIAAGCRDLIVCGHYGCSKFAAASDTHTAHTDLALAIALEHAEAAARAAHGNRDRAVECNVRQQLLHLRTHPPIAAALAANSLRLLAWVYDPHADMVWVPDERLGRRRAALDPVHNFAFRPERIRSAQTTAPPGLAPFPYLT